MNESTRPDSELWAAAWRALDEALALEPQARAVWLADIAAKDPRYAQVLQRLLQAASTDGNESSARFTGGGGTLGAETPARLFAGAMGARVPELNAGSMIGDYRLVRMLGQGGMATVWLAEQTEGVIRQVALKIPHAGLEPAAATTGRFIRERDLLAGLEHERIARLYDAGVTAAGIPFLAMEWIDGVALTRYSDENRLGIDARLALFRQVLDAVGFAHSRLVIHRDLKPSNILVTAGGQVKLLDFGVANLMADPDVTADPVGGAPVLDAMTPDSASPEQLAGQPLSTRSDVYSLGVVLYELLSGAKPYSLGRNTPSLHATLMATSIAPPDAAATAAAAELRRESEARLRRRLKGELGSILARCLEKDPANRYSDVGALAADLDRLVRHEPVSAHGTGALYRLRCFARRQRWPLLVGTALLLVVTAGVIATQWQARAALAEAQRAEAIQRFLLSLFRSNTPTVAAGHEITAKELLTRGAERADADLRGQPRALAELHSELGDIFNEMGENQAAMSHLQRSLDGFAQLGLSDSRPALEALFRRGIIHIDRAEWQLARADEQSVLERGLALYGPRHRWAVGAREKLAFIHLENGEDQAALDTGREALAQPPGEDADNDALRRLRVKVIIGEAQTNLGDFSAARQILTEAVAESNGPAGYGAVDRLVYKVLLTRAIFYSGDFAAAEPAAAALVAEEQRVLGRDHPLVFPARQLWSNTLAAQGRYQDAVAVARETLQLAQEHPEPSAERIALQRYTLSQRLIQAGRYTEAEPLMRASLEYFLRRPEGMEQRPPALRLLANSLLGQGRIADARAELDTAVATARGIKGFTRTPDWIDIQEAQANLLRVSGSYMPALPLLSEACARLDRSPGAQTAPAVRCAAQLAWLRAKLAPDDAAARAAFVAAANRYAALLPPEHVARLDLKLLQAELTSSGQSASDTKSLRDAWRQSLGVDSPSHIIFLH